MPSEQGRHGSERTDERGVRRWAAATVALAVLGASAEARAINCSTLPSPIYGIGGSAQKPLIARVAAKLAAATPAVTVVYQAPGACNGIYALINDTLLTGTASYWDATGTEQSCTLDIAGQAPDFANMGTQATSCPDVAALPDGVGDFTGPVSAYEIIVPVASSQQSISAEALYFVYGFGAQGAASPWVDETEIIKRDALSAAQIFVSLATGVPGSRFKGVDARSNGNTVTLVAGAANPEAAIGFVSGDVADANRATVRPLAYQHFDQSCGYWADSTASSLDKANVRSGQYYLWAPTHFFARVDTTGAITNPLVADFVGYFTGAVTPPPNLNILDLEIRNGNIPRCAMNVWRTTDLGAPMSYQPPEPCGCYFESLAAGSTACTPCASNTDCPGSAPVCRHNFCEVI